MLVFVPAPPLAQFPSALIQAVATRTRAPGDCQCRSFLLII